MYQPKYSISDNLLNSIVKLETEKRALNLAEISLKSRNKLARKTKTLNIFHFGHIIGINITLRDAEKLAEGKKLVTDDARGTILNNFRNALEFNRSNIADTYIDIDTSIMLHLNKILLTDWKEPWDSKFRTSGEEIDLSLDNWATLRDHSIDPGSVQKELDELVNWHRNNASRINPIIRIATLIAGIVRISPFVYANKLTTIAIADFLLQKNSYLEKTFLPTARNFDIYEDEYIESWNQQRLNPELPNDSNNKDISLWIERFSRNLAKELDDTKKEIQQETKETEQSTKKPFLDLNKRQLKILRYLQTIPTVKREDYVQMMDVSTMTAYRDLNELVSKKLIKVVGQGRGTKYMLTNR